MTIKGLAIISGSLDPADYKHEISNDGDVRLGTTDATASSLLGGKVHIKGLAAGSDLATELNALSGSVANATGVAFKIYSAYTRAQDITTELGNVATVLGAESSDFSYAPDTNANYVDDATSFHDADEQLATKLVELSGALSTLNADETNPNSVSGMIRKYLKGGADGQVTYTMTQLEAALGDNPSLATDISNRLDQLEQTIRGTVNTLSTDSLEESVEIHENTTVTTAAAVIANRLGDFKTISGVTGNDSSDFSYDPSIKDQDGNTIDAASISSVRDADEKLDAAHANTRSRKDDMVEIGITTANLTVAGDTFFEGDVVFDTDADMQVPTYDNQLPTHIVDEVGALLADQTPFNGETFYLKGVTGLPAPFTIANKFYFCEDGVWFASPFWSEGEEAEGAPAGGGGTPDISGTPVIQSTDDPLVHEGSVLSVTGVSNTTGAETYQWLATVPNLGLVDTPIDGAVLWAILMGGAPVPPGSPWEQDGTAPVFVIPTDFPGLFVGATFDVEVSRNGVTLNTSAPVTVTSVDAPATGGPLIVVAPDDASTTPATLTIDVNTTDILAGTELIAAIGNISDPDGTVQMDGFTWLDTNDGSPVVLGTGSALDTTGYTGDEVIQLVVTTLDDTGGTLPANGLVVQYSMSVIPDVTTATETITDAGGTVTLTNATVTVPAGALATGASEDITATLKLTSDTSYNNPFQEIGGDFSGVLLLGPEGYSFEPGYPVSVNIALDTAPAVEADIAIYVQSVIGNAWTRYALNDGTNSLTYDAGTNSVTFEVTSFSSYLAGDSTIIDPNEERFTNQQMAEQMPFNVSATKTTTPTNYPDLTYEVNNWDYYPQEFGFLIDDNSGAGNVPVIMPPTYDGSPTTLTIPTGNYVFTMFDTFGDGGNMITFKDSNGATVGSISIEDAQESWSIDYIDGVLTIGHGPDGDPGFGLVGAILDATGNDVSATAPLVATISTLAPVQSADETFSLIKIPSDTMIPEVLIAEGAAQQSQQFNITPTDVPFELIMSSSLSDDAAIDFLNPANSATAYTVSAAAIGLTTTDISYNGSLYDGADIKFPSTADLASVVPFDVTVEIAPLAAGATSYPDLTYEVNNWDYYPQEFGFLIDDNSGAGNVPVIMPPTYDGSPTTLTIPTGNYVFTMFDTFGDGGNMITFKDSNGATVGSISIEDAQESWSIDYIDGVLTIGHGPDGDPGNWNGAILDATNNDVSATAPLVATIAAAPTTSPAQTATVLLDGVEVAAGTIDSPTTAHFPITASIDVRDIGTGGDTPGAVTISFKDPITTTVLSTHDGEELEETPLEVIFDSTLNIDGSTLWPMMAPDADGDGTPDDEDAFKNDPNQQVDADDDGLGPNNTGPDGGSPADNDGDGFWDQYDLDDTDPNVLGSGINYPADGSAPTPAGPTVTLVGTDSYGDGWNGGSLVIKAPLEAGGEVLASFTLPGSGTNSANSETRTFLSPNAQIWWDNGSDFTWEFTAGGYADEVMFGINKPDGSTVLPLQAHDGILVADGSSTNTAAASSGDVVRGTFSGVAGDTDGDGYADDVDEYYGYDDDMMVGLHAQDASFAIGYGYVNNYAALPDVSLHGIDIGDSPVAGQAGGFAADGTVTTYTNLLDHDTLPNYVAGDTNPPIDKIASFIYKPHLQGVQYVFSSTHYGVADITINGTTTTSEYVEVSSLIRHDAYNGSGDFSGSLELSVDGTGFPVVNRTIDGTTTNLLEIPVATITDPGKTFVQPPAGFDAAWVAANPVATMSTILSSSMGTPYAPSTDMYTITGPDADKFEIGYVLDSNLAHNGIHITDLAALSTPQTLNITVHYNATCALQNDSVNLEIQILPATAYSTDIPDVFIDDAAFQAAFDGTKDTQVLFVLDAAGSDFTPGEETLSATFDVGSLSFDSADPNHMPIITAVGINNGSDIEAILEGPPGTSVWCYIPVEQMPDGISRGAATYKRDIVTPAGTLEFAPVYLHTIGDSYYNHLREDEVPPMSQPNSILIHAEDTGYGDTCTKITRGPFDNGSIWPTVDRGPDVYIPLSAFSNDTRADTFASGSGFVDTWENATYDAQTNRQALYALPGDTLSLDLSNPDISVTSYPETLVDMADELRSIAMDDVNGWVYYNSLGVSKAAASNNKESILRHSPSTGKSEAVLSLDDTSLPAKLAHLNTSHFLAMTVDPTYDPFNTHASPIEGTLFFITCDDTGSGQLVKLVVLSLDAYYDSGDLEASTTVHDMPITSIDWQYSNFTMHAEPTNQHIYFSYTENSGFGEGISRIPYVNSTTETVDPERFYQTRDSSEPGYFESTPILPGSVSVNYHLVNRFALDSQNEFLYALVQVNEWTQPNNSGFIHRTAIVRLPFDTSGIAGPEFILELDMHGTAYDSADSGVGLKENTPLSLDINAGTPTLYWAVPYDGENTSYSQNGSIWRADVTDAATATASLEKVTSTTRKSMAWRYYYASSQNPNRAAYSRFDQHVMVVDSNNSSLYLMQSWKYDSPERDAILKIPMTPQVTSLSASGLDVSWHTKDVATGEITQRATGTSFTLPVEFNTSSIDPEIILVVTAEDDNKSNGAMHYYRPSDDSVMLENRFSIQFRNTGYDFSDSPEMDSYPSFSLINSNQASSDWPYGNSFQHDAFSNTSTGVTMPTAPSTYSYTMTMDAYQGQTINVDFSKLVSDEETSVENLIVTCSWRTTYHDAATEVFAHTTETFTIPQNAPIGELQLHVTVEDENGNTQTQGSYYNRLNILLDEFPADPAELIESSETGVGANMIAQYNIAVKETDDIITAITDLSASYATGDGSSHAQALLDGNGAKQTAETCKTDANNLINAGSSAEQIAKNTAIATLVDNTVTLWNTATGSYPWVDTDADTVPDHLDAFENDPSESVLSPISGVGANMYSQWETFLDVSGNFNNSLGGSPPGHIATLVEAYDTGNAAVHAQTLTSGNNDATVAEACKSGSIALINVSSSQAQKDKKDEISGGITTILSAWDTAKSTYALVDTDGDGTYNHLDAFPFDPEEDTTASNDPNHTDYNVGMNMMVQDIIHANLDFATPTTALSAAYYAGDAAGVTSAKALGDVERATAVTCKAAVLALIDDSIASGGTPSPEQTARKDLLVTNIDADIVAWDAAKLTYTLVDTDGDGTYNHLDAFPFDPEEDTTASNDPNHADYNVGMNMMAQDTIYTNLDFATPTTELSSAYSAGDETGVTSAKATGDVERGIAVTCKDTVLALINNSISASGTPSPEQTARKDLLVTNIDADIVAWDAAKLTYTLVDTDGDGVVDVVDAFPDDISEDTRASETPGHDDYNVGMNMWNEHINILECKAEMEQLEITAQAAYDTGDTNALLAAQSSAQTEHTNATNAKAAALQLIADTLATVPAGTPHADQITRKDDIVDLFDNDIAPAYATISALSLTDTDADGIFAETIASQNYHGDPADSDAANPGDFPPASTLGTDLTFLKSIQESLTWNNTTYQYENNLVSASFDPVKNKSRHESGFDIWEGNTDYHQYTTDSIGSMGNQFFAIPGDEIEFPEGLLEITNPNLREDSTLEYIFDVHSNFPSPFASSSAVTWNTSSLMYPSATLAIPNDAPIRDGSQNRAYFGVRVTDKFGRVAIHKLGKGPYLDWQGNLRIDNNTAYIAEKQEHVALLLSLRYNSGNPDSSDFGTPEDFKVQTYDGAQWVDREIPTGSLTYPESSGSSKWAISPNNPNYQIYIPVSMESDRILFGNEERKVYVTNPSSSVRQEVGDITIDPYFRQYTPLLQQNGGSYYGYLHLDATGSALQATQNNLYANASAAGFGTGSVLQFSGTTFTVITHNSRGTTDSNNGTLQPQLSIRSDAGNVLINDIMQASLEPDSDRDKVREFVLLENDAAYQAVVDKDGDGTSDWNDAFPDDATYTTDTIPVLTLVGDAAVTTIQDNSGTYTDLGATAQDAEEGDISASVSVGGQVVDLSQPGTYTITYDVTDVHGNQAVQINRTVTVVADTDQDGVPDASDAFPNDPSETTDSDADGVGDNADAFPNDPAETVASSETGVGANMMAQHAIYAALDFATATTNLTNAYNAGDVAALAAAIALGDAEKATAETCKNNTLNLINANSSAEQQSKKDTISNGIDALLTAWQQAKNTYVLVDTDGDGVSDNVDAFPADPAESVASAEAGVGANMMAQHAIYAALDFATATTALIAAWGAGDTVGLATAITNGDAEKTTAEACKAAALALINANSSTEQVAKKVAISDGIDALLTAWQQAKNTYVLVDTDGDGIFDHEDPSPLDATMPSAPILYDWSALSFVASGSNGTLDGNGSTPTSYSSFVPMLGGDTVTLSSTTSKARASVSFIGNEPLPSDGDTFTIVADNGTQHVFTARTSPTLPEEFQIGTSAGAFASNLGNTINDVASADFYATTARHAWARTTDQTYSDPNMAVYGFEIVQLSGGEGKSISSTFPTGSVNLEQSTFTTSSFHFLPGLSGDTNSSDGMEVNYRLMETLWNPSSTVELMSSGWIPISQDWTYTVPAETSESGDTFQIIADFRNQYGQEERFNSDRMSNALSRTNGRIFVAKNQAGIDFLLDDGTYDHSSVVNNNLSAVANWTVTDVGGSTRNLDINVGGTGPFRGVTIDGTVRWTLAAADAGNSFYNSDTLVCVEGDTISMSTSGANENLVLKNGNPSTDVQHAFRANQYGDLSWGSETLYDTTNQWTVGGQTPDFGSFHGQQYTNTYAGGNTLAATQVESGWRDFTPGAEQDLGDGLNITGPGPNIIVLKNEQYYQNASANWLASGSIFGTLPIDDE